MPWSMVRENEKLGTGKNRVSHDLDKDGGALGFEDFCVLQGKGTKQKYDASLESCANTICQYVSPQFQQQALYDFFKITLINILVRNGDAHLKNSGVVYQNLKLYHLGQLPEAERKLAPVFDIVSTIPYIKNDTMALSLTGSKRWPKWYVLKKFAKQHCRLNNLKIDQAVDEVYSAREQVLPLLAKLSSRHDDFLTIAEAMNHVIEQPF